MNEIIDLMKELFMLKNNDKFVVGLSAFNKVQQKPKPKMKKQVKKEVRISDLMRKTSA